MPWRWSVPGILFILLSISCSINHTYTFTALTLRQNYDFYYPFLLFFHIENDQGFEWESFDNIQGVIIFSADQNHKKYNFVTLGSNDTALNFFISTE